MANYYDRLSRQAKARQYVRSLDPLSGTTFGTSKRFDSLNGGTFGSEKRNMDEIDRAGFRSFNKKNFDEIDRAGFTSFAKRPMDEIDRAGFNRMFQELTLGRFKYDYCFIGEGLTVGSQGIPLQGVSTFRFQKRPMDEIDRAGFTHFAKRPMDEIDRAGFDHFVKREAAPSQNDLPPISQR